MMAVTRGHPEPTTLSGRERVVGRAQMGFESGAPLRSLIPISTVLASGDRGEAMRRSGRFLGHRRTT